MRIGFDLDKILINYPPLVPDRLIDFLYKERSNGVLKYRIPTRPEQLLRLMTHYPLLRQPIKRNIDFIKELKEQNHAKYYLISSRFGFLKKRTDEIIEKNNFNSIFDGMFFNSDNRQPHLFKNSVVRKLGLDRYVDDDLPLLGFLSKQNKGINFYWLNKDTKKKLSKNLFAIIKLSDILV